MHRIKHILCWVIIMSGAICVRAQAQLIKFSNRGLVEGMVVGGRDVQATSKKGFYSLPGVGKGKPDFFSGSFAGGKLDLANGSEIGRAHV